MKIRFCGILYIILLFLLGCAKPSNYVCNTKVLPRIASHVILIGLDGFNFDDYGYIRNYHNINYLTIHGASTFNKRSVIPSSSAINWASTMMGVPPEMHGYTEWGSKTPDVPSVEINNNGIFPTIFSLCRDQIPLEETGCMFEWPGIKYLVDTLTISFVKQLNSEIDSIESNVDIICKYLHQKKPFFSFVKLMGLTIWDILMVGIPKSIIHI